MQYTEALTGWRESTNSQTRDGATLNATSIQDVAADLTLETVLDIWQNATDRLQETHLTLQREISRLSDELEEKNRQLARKDRLADLGQMAAHVAHEVRNNLVPMTLYMNLLKRLLGQRSVSSDPEQDRALELLGKIESGFDSMRTMVGDLLNFTSDRQPTCRPFAIAPFLEDLVDEVRSQCQAQCVSLRVHHSPDDVFIGDSEMLKRALRNLMLNAVDALQEGGQLTLTAQRADNSQAITVEDNGPGIAENIAEKLFDPFVTTKDTGTGLGLSIVERIAEAHQGKIDFLSQADQGAKFTLRWPVPPLESPIESQQTEL